MMICSALRMELMMKRLSRIIFSLFRMCPSSTGTGIDEAAKATAQPLAAMAPYCSQCAQPAKYKCPRLVLFTYLYLGQRHNA